MARFSERGRRKFDRKKLGRAVFGDEAALSDLADNAQMLSDRQNDIERERLSGRKLFAIDAIALIESGLGALCDETVAVTAPEDVRLKRIMAREIISEEYALLRIRAQLSDEFFKQNCTPVLENADDEIADFRKDEGAFLKNAGRNE
jgi:dephospho-CoA kinase